MGGVSGAWDIQTFLHNADVDIKRARVSSSYTRNPSLADTIMNHGSATRVKFPGFQEKGNPKFSAKE